MYFQIMHSVSKLKQLIRVKIKVELGWTSTRHLVELLHLLFSIFLFSTEV